VQAAEGANRDLAPLARGGVQKETKQLTEDNDVATFRIPLNSSSTSLNRPSDTSFGCFSEALSALLAAVPSIPTYASCAVDRTGTWFLHPTENRTSLS